MFGKGCYADRMMLPPASARCAQAWYVIHTMSSAGSSLSKTSWLGIKACRVTRASTANSLFACRHPLVRAKHQIGGCGIDHPKKLQHRQGCQSLLCTLQQQLTVNKGYGGGRSRCASRSAFHSAVATFLIRSGICKGSAAHTSTSLAFGQPLVKGHQP